VPVERLIIEFVHRTATGDACAPFERREVCRDFSHWLLKINDHLCPDWDEAKWIVDTEAKKTRGRDPINSQISELKISIRPTSEVPYPLPQKAMNLAVAAGVYRISVENALR